MDLGPDTSFLPIENGEGVELVLSAAATSTKLEEVSIPEGKHKKPYNKP